MQWHSTISGNEKCLHLFTPVMNPHGLLNQSATRLFRMTGDCCLLWQLEQAAAEIKLKHLLSVEAEVKTKWKYRSCHVVLAVRSSFQGWACWKLWPESMKPAYSMEKSLFHVHCLFPRHRHSALWDTLNCDILVTEVPPELVTDLSSGFCHSHPRSYKLFD